MPWNTVDLMDVSRNESDDTRTLLDNAKIITCALKKIWKCN